MSNDKLKEDKENKELTKALLKKAMGYSVDEIVEEYERDNPDKEKLNRSIRKRRFLHHSHDFHKRNRVSFT